MKANPLRIRAIRTKQAGTDVFAFFLPGSRISDIAELSRLGVSELGTITGFQRPEIRSHVRNIVSYLNRGAVLFPNAIIIALGPSVRFSAARGTKPDALEHAGEAGTLSIPIHAGKKIGWIVDGQQRSIALAETVNQTLPVPVIAFISNEINTHREQFILVNKAKPLSPRLIDELLPEVGSELPRDLAVRRVPSALINILNSAPDSPFCNLIRRPSCEGAQAVVTDSALLKAVRRSIQDPRGALAIHVSPDGRADLDQMFGVLVAFWSAVRDAFPNAWGLPAERSRLMHAAGIEAMGVLMDQVLSRLLPNDDVCATAQTTLRAIAPACRWTSGRWDAIDRAWNDIQCTPRDIRLLSNHLLSLERGVFRKAAA
ncbi:MAG TPA: DGQHR domain-containing protein DpdB [Rhizomicrobium sp.]|jgi:DGQHR domain-containing protein